MNAIDGRFNRMIPMKAVLTLFVLATFLLGCTQSKEAVSPSSSSAPMTAKPDLHTSQNSLDWAGAYEGVLPCADCPGIKTRLTLNKDGTYERKTQYLERQVTAETVSGVFKWQASGNAVTLDERGGRQQFAVGEGRLTLLYSNGQSAGSPVPNSVLTLVPQESARTISPQTLERYQWTLESATDSQNRRIAMLPPGNDHAVLLNFSGSRLNIQGPCNRIIASYQINDGKQLIVRGGPASTMMACDPALMNADRALSRILANPLNVEMNNDSSPRLRLTSSSNETLTFVGQATPEALYGPGTRMFLEVSAHEVACEHPPAPNTRCLQVRERHFDEQGLPAGAPGEWHPLHENIEGFTHKEGFRNVLRINRFNRNTTSTGASSNLYVLDMIVESELVKP